MGNKSIQEREASKEIFAIARQEADVEITNLKQQIQAGKEEGYSIGAIKANKAHRDYCNFLDAVVLYKMKKSKDYKKAGITWEQFCEEAGYPRRTAEEIIDQVTPVFELFAANLPVLAGVTINDIRWLGKNKPAAFAGFADDGKSLIIGDKQIPATPEDITAYINHLQETHQQAIDQKDADIRQKNRLLGDNQKHLNKLDAEVARLQKTVPKSELTEEEQDACNLLHQVQVDIMSWFSDIKKKIQPHKAPEIALRQYYYLLIFFAKLAMDERVALQEEYKNAEETPWEISEMELPPVDVMIDNLPMTAGKGLGKKVVAKMEERKNKKSKK